MRSRFLVGQDDSHLSPAAATDQDAARIHRDAVEPFRSLRAAAAGSGFDLAILSGFRSFDRQLSIWNRKAAGQLMVMDSNAHPLDIGALTARELVFAILRWSALPGASRHHWGTDIDVYDAAATPAGYEVELVPAEVDPGGMFGPLHDWLDDRMAAGSAFGFYRPYDRDRGGVAPERWHLSCAPVASRFERLLTRDLLRETIATAEMRLRETVLSHLDEIYDRFVVNVNPDTPSG